MVARPAASRLACALVVPLALAGAFVPARGAAQDRAAVDADLRRSAIIQAAIAHIEAHRAEFVHDLLMTWSSYVDPNRYDLFETLGPIAMRAPAWQLYGASLVGDFPTMVRVLRGEEGAGAHINALAEQPAALQAYDPTWEVVEPAALGDANDSLVYTPIAPCRLVDTRNTGALTGLLQPGGSRSFRLYTLGLIAGQGGSQVPCPGLPTAAQPAWAVNVTVTGHSGPGWLTAWGFGGTEPNASIINYSPTLGPAVANGLVLTGCAGCVQDITVKAAVSAVHVIIDVVGSFKRATAANAAVTRLAGSTVNIAGQSSGGVQGGHCPAGTQLIGGDVQIGGADLSLADFRQASATSWWAYVFSRVGFTNGVTVFSRCMDRPVTLP
ncbi:MAG: hypothetical protein KJ066_23585 [Acidobacteria bacterium]|nr:hypothetical protein [Acidobacteriota bacterium]